MYWHGHYSCFFFVSVFLSLKEGKENGARESVWAAFYTVITTWMP
jgi:hypothetical protein